MRIDGVGGAGYLTAKSPKEAPLRRDAAHVVRRRGGRAAVYRWERTRRAGGARGDIVIMRTPRVGTAPSYTL